MAEIEFRNVSKSFGTYNVIQHLDVTIQDGSFTVLVGPSGCGKTTLLRMIAGIGPQSDGQILIDGKDMTDVAPGQRDVAMVFQNYAIYPTMSVYGNIEFGLKNNKVPKAERKRRIREVAEKVGLTDYLDRSPSTLSGGQRQRVALARAMSKNPKVFLMDEPLSNLDAKLRSAMRVELIELHRKLKTTFVYVTHDQVEAMSMADTIILMDHGEVQQIGSPEEIYRNPTNLFVAQFIGSPAMNIVKKEDCTIGFRPEAVCLTKEYTNAAFSVPGTISTREMLGRETNYSIRDGQGNTYMVTSPMDDWRPQQQVYLNVERASLYVFGKDGNRLPQWKERWYEKSISVSFYFSGYDRNSCLCTLSDGEADYTELLQGQSDE